MAGSPGLFRRQRIGKRIAVSILVLLLPTLIIASWTRSLNHDEEQFVASGALLARSGLLPYVDYPYFHFPNLVFVYAGIFLTNSHLLLTARTFSALCAWALLLLVFALAARQFSSLAEGRWSVACAFTLVLVLNPIFRYTADLAWNHSLPVLLTMAAFTLLLPTNRSRLRYASIMMSGILLALAVGTRLSFLPLLFPFLIIVLWKAENRLASLLVFSSAFFIASLPVIILMMTDPRRFFFDTVTYNGAINLRYRQAAGATYITAAGKLLYALKEAFNSPSNALLCLAFVSCYLWPLSSARLRSPLSSDSKAILLLLPFLLIGAWMPTPSFRQYYYPFIPFLVSGIIFQGGRIFESARRQSSVALILLVAVGVIELLPNIMRIPWLCAPMSWPALAVHQQGVRISRITGGGPMLALSPIYPLEGGATIYKEFATGPFAWRAAPFVAKEDKARCMIVDADDLEAYLMLRSPRAILTGFENRSVEDPLVVYAESKQYKRQSLGGRRVVWIRP